jgi:cation:H+ antiporter
VIAVFLAAAAVTWIAGITLSDATDGLDDRFHLGSALGGMLLLGFAGTLPELAITTSAAINDNLGMATGNLLGGIAMQTLVLALLDATSKRGRPLFRLTDAVEPLIEATLVVVLVAIALMGSLLDADATIGPVSPASIAIVVFYVIGLMMLNRVKSNRPWEPAVAGAGAPGDGAGAPGAGAPDAAGSDDAREGNDADPGPAVAPGRFAGRPTRAIVLWFSIASIVTLVAGVILERTGNTLADRWGINGAIFGATILAAVTALPEVSTGIRAVRLGDVGLAMSDIFGGNAAQMVLFLLADLLAGAPVLRSVSTESAWLGLLGIIVTAIYLGGLLARPDRKLFRMGPAAFVVILVYVAGVVGLLFLR